MKKKTIRNSVFPYLKTSVLSGDLLSFFKDSQNKHTLLKASNSSYVHLLVSQIFKEEKATIMLVFNKKEEALYALNEFENWFSKSKVLFFPSTYLNPYQVEEVENANIVLRTEVIKKLQSSEPYIIISYADAVSEKIINKKSLQEKSFEIKKGDAVDSGFLNELLFEYHFKRVDYVSEPGEFAVRGSIIDVFSYSDELPVRINFFGDEVERLKLFDIENQLSTKNIDSFVLIPNIQNLDLSSERESILRQLPESSLVVLNESDLIANSLNNNFKKASEIFQNTKGLISRLKPEFLYLQEKELRAQLSEFKTLEYASPKSLFKDVLTMKASCKEQPTFHKNFDWLAKDLLDNKNRGIDLFINCNSEKQSERLQDIFEELGYHIDFKPTFSYLHRGFIDQENKFLVYTDHQIFDRYHSFSNRNRFAKSESLTMKELTQLKVGDYVTHIDHGVGKFMGLKKLNNNGKIQEAIKLTYLNEDILYVNIHSLHKITKHSSGDSVNLKLDKLGSKSWMNRKNKTKSRVKELAFDLIKLYAQRKNQKGFAFEPDSYLQNELEASFLYEDTIDQEKATLEVKRDMQSEKIMDRLICGDVGFGKTEVAIRAAFKAVLSGKQVAVLVPTTILAYQHFNTFVQRFKDFPVTLDYLSRFRSTKEKNEIYEKVQTGKIDIIIGTHQLAQKDLKFKDLGLLIIDEEHKFGVNVKDKLKTLKANVDTLTLTATPIPRTLQFSLMSARDMSVIKTPPSNRQPVETKRIMMNEEILRDAILLELQRGGQVFFIHNRIENLSEVAGMLQRLVPEARIITGHGQMDGKQLEKNLLDFINHKKDILVATSIIESGLDIPNSNTIFINNAHNFGLADLHQMRGRVGRSNIKAYCYLIAPENEVLTDEARKRLNAVESFSDLGSGFHIALKDLEIRGAGDILGAEQSGFISDVGFDAYQRIMNEAINELKNSDFKDLFKEEDLSPQSSEVVIDTDLEILIPNEYVNDVEVRLGLYQRLSEINTPEELQQFKEELIDRFGELPPSVLDLLKSVALKQLCVHLGIQKLTLKQNTMLCYLPEEGAAFYQSEKFQQIIQWIHQNPKNIQLKEKMDKDGKVLYLRIDHVKNLDDALSYIQNKNSVQL